METALTMDSEGYEEEFEIGEEPLCLEFVNTVSSRKGAVPHEWLSSYANLVTWSYKAGLLSYERAQGLLRRAQTEPSSAASVLARAVALRNAIYRIFSAYAAERPIPPDDLDLLNRELPEAYRHVQLAPLGDSCTWSWQDDSSALDVFLWPVLRSTADLLTSPDLERTGECQNPTCGWLFLDTSKNHSRRWCDMNDCGNQAKARSFYRRKRERKTL
jgi:predicted RNA-binding Zn ribbon-like protein